MTNAELVNKLKDELYKEATRSYRSDVNLQTKMKEKVFHEDIDRFLEIILEKMEDEINEQL